MEEEAMASEGTTFLVREGNNMSLYTNGQVSSEQPDTSEQQQNILKVTGTNQEDSPTVVVKKTISLRMQSTIVNGVPFKSTESVERTVATEMEKVPILLPVKGPKSTAVAAEDERLIQESELIAVEKTPYRHPTFYSGVAEVSEEDEIPGETSVFEGAEDVPDSYEGEHVLNFSEVGDHKEDEKALDPREPIEESSPVVIDKRPASLHVEQLLHDEGSTEIQEQIEEASAVAVESEPRVCDYHPMLEETLEGENVDRNSVEVEYQPAARTPGNKDEMETETKETITEESPLVLEKRPVSLHMEAVFEHKEHEEVRKPIEEVPREIIEKRHASLHMEQMFNEERSDEVQEPIEEASTVAVESEPRVYDYHPMLEETVQDENDDGNFVEVQYEPAATTLRNKEEMEAETQTVTEESPYVVEKRPASLHLEAAFEQKEDEELRKPVKEAPHEIIEKRPVSLHVDQIFNEEEGVEVQEPIEEASAVAVESEPRACEYHPMLEETEEDENADGNSMGVEYEPAITTLGNEEEMETETTETITEESPLVVEKRPVSLHMEAAFDHKEDEEVRKPIEETPHEIIEKRPVSIHVEQMFIEERSDEVQVPIEEASAVAVQTEPKLFDYHPMLEERVENTNVHDNSVEVEYEPIASKAETKEETKNETETRETVAEESPLVLERRPVSLHIEAAFDHKEDVKEPIEEDPPQIIEKRPVSLHVENILDENVASEVQEPIEVASALAVESQPRVCDYHPMLEETVKDENVDGNSVEVEYEPAAATHGNENETETEAKDAITEESPFVVEKRPASLHLEAVFEHKGEGEVEEPIEEAPLEVIEKRPASLHVEQVFNDEGSTEVQEPIEEASAIAVESEPRVYDYHPMLEETEEDENVDGNSVEVEYEPAATTPENEDETVSEAKRTIAEESPFVVEKRPVSLHMEAAFDQNEEGEVKEPVEEAPLEIIEKRPVSLHIEQMFKEKESAGVQEPIKEASALAVESEPRVCEYHPMLEETVGDENVDGNSVEVDYGPAAMKLDFEGQTETEAKEAITEESPLVVEKRPVSVHMEAVFKPKEEVKEAIEEVPLEITEKRPVSLHMEQVFNEERNTEAQKPAEEASAVAVETEPRLFHYHPILEEKAEDKNVNNKSVEVEYEPAATKREREEETKTDTREAIAEESPLVVETRPVSLHLEVVVDHEKGPEVEKPIEETPPIVVEKTPTNNSQESESVAKEVPSSVHILDMPEVGKVKEVEDSVQEAVALAVERKAPEFHHELLQTVETEDEEPENTTLEVKLEENQVRETEILDDEVQVPELKGNEAQESKRSEVVTKTEVISTVTISQRISDETTQEMETNVVQTTYEKKTMEYSDTSTTEETFASTSFTKLNQHGLDDDEELLRHVLRKRLSAPEVLPEKENDGSAPLATSEDRGILESQEQFAFADNSRKKDSTPVNKPQVSGAAPSGTEPYEDVPDEEKLVADARGEAEVAVDDSVENEERAEESLPVLLLLAPEGEKGENANERKKGKTTGPSSPQCKCCSLM